MGRPTPESLGRKVVVKAYRKHGNGAKGGGRKGQTGKKGSIYQLGNDGNCTKLATCEEPNFTELSKKLFATNFIPRHVRINSNGETHF